MRSTATTHSRTAAGVSGVGRSDTLFRESDDQLALPAISGKLPPAKFTIIRQNEKKV